MFTEDRCYYVPCSDPQVWDHLSGGGEDSMISLKHVAPGLRYYKPIREVSESNGTLLNTSVAKNIRNSQQNLGFIAIS